MPRTSTKESKKTSANVKTRIYDTANYLRDEQDMAAYLQAALVGGEARVIATALDDVFRKLQDLTRDRRHDAAEFVSLI